MAFSKTLIPLFFLLLIAKNVVSQRDTTTFTYDSFNQSSTNLIFQGDASIPSNSSLFVRLTRTDSSGQPMRGSIGRVVYSNPVSFWDEGLQASFITTFQFLVNAGNNPSLGVGDGFNFFMVPVNSTIPPGSVDGDLGLFNPQTGNASSVFAVEFDIAPNPWDPRYHHLGIDINSRVSRNVSRFENSRGRVVTAQISYVSWTRTISVVATYGTYTSTLSYVFDLKTILPKQVHVGISGTTGSWVAFHNLYTWAFTSTLVPDANSQLDKTYIPQYV